MFNTVLVQPLANGLIVFYKLLGGNLGVAIIGFSIFLRYLLNPLTKPYMNSMKRMKEYAPQLEKLKSKFKGDKMKFAQAQADFYKEKGINPSAGCLPYILQIVILIAFFNVFQKTLYDGGDITAKFNTLLYQPLKFSQDQIVNTRFLYLDMAKPDVFHLPNVPFPIPGPFLIMAAVLQFVSSKLMAPVISQEKKIADKTKPAADDMAVAMQSSMAYTFPLFTLIFGMNFPSGLAIYWLIFSLFQVSQQMDKEKWDSFKALIRKSFLLK